MCLPQDLLCFCTWPSLSGVTAGGPLADGVPDHLHKLRVTSEVHFPGQATAAVHVHVILVGLRSPGENSLSSSS